METSVQVDVHVKDSFGDFTITCLFSTRFKGSETCNMKSSLPKEFSYSCHTFFSSNAHPKNYYRLCFVYKVAWPEQSPSRNSKDWIKFWAISKTLETPKARPTYWPQPACSPITPVFNRLLSARRAAA
jgi:hypothetical protein